MIPVLIVFGVLAGRWWGVALAAGSATWICALALTSGITSWEGALAAGVLGLANTGVGVALHQVALRAWRSARRVSPSSWERPS